MNEQAELDKKREAIRPYFGDQEKVDKMSAKQVIAIYLKFKTEGKVQ